MQTTEVTGEFLQVCNPKDLGNGRRGSAQIEVARVIEIEPGGGYHI